MAIPVLTAVRMSVNAMRVLLVKMVAHVLIDLGSIIHVFVWKGSVETTVRVMLLFVTPNHAATAEHVWRAMD